MDFRIVVDTREQLPYEFGCATVRRKLEAGDYSVEGFEGQVAVERKSLADFTKTVVHDRERFAVELERLQQYRAACVVVEADLDAVLRGAHAETLRAVWPQTLLGSALHVSLRHRVPVFWCGSRPAARCYTEQFLRMFVRLQAQEAVA